MFYLSVNILSEESYIKEVKKTMNKKKQNLFDNSVIIFTRKVAVRLQLVSEKIQGFYIPSEKEEQL